jgi:CRISPR system Cascade subunit CasC
MRLIELHILQSFPVSCLNRDDVGAPKTAVFGGVTRARISSQCLKRAIRKMAKDIEREAGHANDALFDGVRTLKASQDLSVELERVLPEERRPQAVMIANAVCHGLLERGATPTASDEGSAAGSGRRRRRVATANAPAMVQPPSPEPTATLLYLSPGELTAIAEGIRANPDRTDFRELAEAALRRRPDWHGPMDAADIAIFGRMVANAHDLTVEGAGLFNHALTTHKAQSELDFWTAVDDNKAPGEDAGAANMNVAEFTSGVFYRYAALNLTLLFDPERGHLRQISDPAVRERLLSTFIRATLLAIPSARDNSHNSHTEIGYALGFYRTQGQPLQLVNAFENPVRAFDGLMGPSVRNMLLHLQRLRDDYGGCVAPAVEVSFGSVRPVPDPEEQKGERLCRIPERANLDNFCSRLAAAATS